jgi:hypothetical protein
MSISEELPAEPETRKKLLICGVQDEQLSQRPKKELDSRDFRERLLDNEPRVAARIIGEDAREWEMVNFHLN